MNNVNLIGRLTKNPTSRQTEEGYTICEFTLAVDDAWSKEDRADFLQITVTGQQADVCQKYLHRGFLVGVSGRLHSEVYSDEEGVYPRCYHVTVIADRVQFCQWPDATA